MIKVPLVRETYQTLTDPNTVAANRQGLVTAEQRASLERASGASVWLGVLIVLVIGAAFLLPSLGALGLFTGGRFNPLGAVCAIPFATIGLFCLMGAFTGPFSARRTKNAITNALQKGTIAQAEGSVIFSGSAYRADANGQRLRMPHGATVPLPPGRYRFYYLPLPPILLSAESLQTPTTSPSRPATIDPLLGLTGYFPAPAPDGSYPYATVDPAFTGLLDALAQSNRFTIEELRLNRGGRMSGRQARRLASGLLFRVIFALCFIGFGFLPVILALTFHARLSSALSIAGLFGLAGVVILLTSLRRIADIVSWRADAIEGWVEPLRDNSGDSTTYYYRIGGKKLQVGARAYQALVPGLTYRVYYAPRSRALLSIEPRAVSPSPVGEGAGG